MNAVASVILDVAFFSQTHLALNVVHPQPTEWNTLMGAINDALAREVKLESPLPLVPFNDWFDSLKKSATTLSLEDQKQLVSTFSFATKHIILIKYLLSSLPSKF